MPGGRPAVNTAAVLTGTAVWVGSTAVAYAVADPAARLGRSAWVTARRWMTGSPADDGLCPVKGTEGAHVLACHLPTGHDVSVIHYDRSRDQRWAATTQGVAVLGQGLRIQ
jgi:hypothetical protein